LTTGVGTKILKTGSHLNLRTLIRTRTSKLNNLRNLIRTGTLKIKMQEPLRTFVFLNNKCS